MNFTSLSWASVVLSTSSKELGTRHQTPTLIGCIFLRNRITNPTEVFFAFPTWLRSAEPWILAQFLKNCQTFENFLFSSPFKLSILQHPALLSEALNYIPVFMPPTTRNFYFLACLSSQAAAGLNPITTLASSLPCLLHLCRTASVAKPSTIAPLRQTAIN